MSERTALCSDCQNVKPWSDFYPRTKWEDGSTRTVYSYCRPCHLARKREWARNNREATRRHNREQCARRRNNPEAKATHRAYQREWERKTYGQRPRVGNGQGSRDGVTIDATAFTEWLRSFNANAEEIARQTGMEPRRVRSLLNGEQTRVELDTVDRALCGYGRPDLLDTLVPRAVA